MTHLTKDQAAAVLRIAVHARGASAVQMRFGSVVVNISDDVSVSAGGLAKVYPTRAIFAAEHGLTESGEPRVLTGQQAAKAHSAITVTHATELWLKFSDETFIMFAKDEVRVGRRGDTLEHYPTRAHFARAYGLEKFT